MCKIVYSPLFSAVSVQTTYLTKVGLCFSALKCRASDLWIKDYTVHTNFVQIVNRNNGLLLTCFSMEQGFFIGSMLLPIQIYYLKNHQSVRHQDNMALSLNTVLGPFNYKTAMSLFTAGSSRVVALFYLPVSNRTATNLIVFYMQNILVSGAFLCFVIVLLSFSFFSFWVHYCSLARFSW